MHNKYNASSNKKRDHSSDGDALQSQPKQQRGSNLVSDQMISETSTSQCSMTTPDCVDELSGIEESDVDTNEFVPSSADQHSQVLLDSNDNKLQTLAANILKEMDPDWFVDASSVHVQLTNNQGSQLQIAPDAIRITVPHSNYCPVTKGSHSNCATAVIVNQDSSTLITCLDSEHDVDGLFRKMVKRDASINQLLMAVWGEDKWMNLLNQRFMQSRVSNGNVSVYEEVMQPKGNDHLKFYKEDDFIKMFGNGFHMYEETLACDGTSIVKRIANPAQKWCSSPTRRRYYGTCYAPGRERIHEDFLNLWCGFNVKSAPDGVYRDPELILKHLREVICSNNPVWYEYLLNWLTMVVVYPYIKTQVALVLKGPKGCGKSTLSFMLRALFGIHCFETSQKDLVFGQFNAHLEKVNIITLNEVVWGGEKGCDSRLKEAITDYFVGIHGKFATASQKENFWNILMLSDARWCVPATPDERRFCVLHVSDAHIGDAEYFKNLYDALQDPNSLELSCFLTFLHRRNLPQNWRAADNIPRTSALNDQVLQGPENADLRWLVRHLRPDANDEDGFQDWQFSYTRFVPSENRNITTTETIMRRNTDTVVDKQLMLLGYKIAQKEDKDLRYHGKISTVADMSEFLTLFFGSNLNVFDKNCRQRGVAHRKPHYKFGPIELIRQYVADHTFHQSDFFSSSDLASTSSSSL